MENSLEIILQRTEWFRQARFRDVYSVFDSSSVEGEWIRSNERAIEVNPILTHLIQVIRCQYGQRL